MPPVVDVDDGALDDGADISRIDRVVDRLPGCAYEQESRAHGERDRGKRDVAEACKPTAREECVEEAVMGILDEQQPELQRSDAERVLQRDVRSQAISS